ncbi:tat (twin-arginine translocation) pathway signal sequence [Streptomyces sp. SID11385]|uniref:tat (twin-arginine translocation) pathway signal sequence n=1 Tax=Streptomyces sp. SID11385 TaxID=2706031 RepID=UPI0013C71178|nr:tat (twin-arginine translocation) pathway signal sequence [Streptomyces sp. SID11385]NEA38126.1 tat (twin-arginine translocation) pathway signal sequence [Streptomyces sp. SID11385]
MSSVARRSLLTATASAAVLCALSFVPSAPDAAAAPAHTRIAAAATPATDDPRLADTGGVDTTPYLVGGLASLGIGAACVTVAVRRARREPDEEAVAL